MGIGVKDIGPGPTWVHRYVFILAIRGTPGRHVFITCCKQNDDTLN